MRKMILEVLNNPKSHLAQLDLLTKANEAMKTMPAGMKDLAVEWIKNMPATKKARLEVIRELSKADRGGLNLVNAHERLQDTIYAVREYVKWSPEVCRSKMNTILPIFKNNTVIFEKPLKQRRLNFIGRLARESYYDVIRVSSNNSFNISVECKDADAWVSDYLDWDGYAKSYGRPMTRHTTTLRIPKGWFASVYKKNIATIGKYFILSAEVMETLENGQEVIKAKAVKNGRGVSIEKVELRITILPGNKAWYEDNPAKFDKFLTSIKN